MFVVDTNVLVYAADRRSECHAACATLLEKFRTQALPWYLTWGIVYEFLRVVTHPKVFPHPLTATQGMDFVNALIGSPAASMLLPTERHAGVLRETVRELPHLRGNIVHDAHTAVLMREHGISQIYTRDTDFHRFPFLSVFDPLSA